jgi:hypothetical protein
MKSALLTSASTFLLIIACLFSTALPVRGGPAAKRGGGLYFSWGFPASKTGSGFNSMEIDLNNIGDPATDQGLFFASQLYCGTAKEKNTFYFGIQTNVQGRGKGIIFSRWGSRSLRDTSVAPGCGEKEAWNVSSDSEGGFIGVRRLTEWGGGRMSLVVAKKQDDLLGRWFGVWLQQKGSAPLYCGALRFPRDSTGSYPMILAEGAGSFVEHYTEVQSEGEVPLWRFLIEGVYVNNRGIKAGPVSYRYAAAHEVWNNSNIAFTRGGWPIVVELGGSTRRRNLPASF